MNLLSFDLNLLKVLDALLCEQSTVKAGERIGLSQSAISAALNRLRALLNDPLFVRQGQRIVPTKYALGLELPLRRVLDDLESLLSGHGDFDPTTAVHNFKISGSDFFAEMLMPPLAKLLAANAHKMQVQLVDLVPNNYVDTLENHEIDLALVPQTEFPNWVDHAPAFRSKFVMIARKNNVQLRRAKIRAGETVPIDLFCNLGHIVFSPEGKLKAMGDSALARIGRQRRIVMTMPVFGGICNAVADSDLVALLPEQMAQKVGTRLRLSIYQAPVKLNPAVICLVWHKRNTSNPAHRWLRTVIMEVLKPLDLGADS
jgi:DNA-binding transcriptional LysR family regulator